MKISESSVILMFYEIKKLINIRIDINQQNALSKSLQMDRLVKGRRTKGVPNPCDCSLDFDRVIEFVPRILFGANVEPSIRRS